MDVFLIQDTDREYEPDDWPKTPRVRCSKAGRRSSTGSRVTGERRKDKDVVPARAGQPLLVASHNVLFSTTLSDMETCYKTLIGRFSTGSKWG